MVRSSASLVGSVVVALSVTALLVAISTDDPMDQCVEYSETDQHDATLAACGEVPTDHEQYLSAQRRSDHARSMLEKQQQAVPTPRARQTGHYQTAGATRER